MDEQLDTLLASALAVLAQKKCGITPAKKRTSCCVIRCATSRCQAVQLLKVARLPARMPRTLWTMWRLLIRSNQHMNPGHIKWGFAERAGTYNPVDVDSLLFLHEGIARRPAPRHTLVARRKWQEILFEPAGVIYALPRGPVNVLKGAMRMTPGANAG